ncbi:MAG: amino acid permease [Bacteroidetes bacterium]|nr:amino acid permease [Bacteroidota bacterium]MBS1634144.1 amino acid permease [Bacteroidota bacterium]
MSSQNTAEGLKTVIGVPALSLSIICGCIGAGIFALPAIVGISLGAFAIFSYIFCGIMFAAILFCYAEIGSRVTSSGGSYAYVEAAFGKFPGYIINWLYSFGWGVIGSAALMNVLADSLAVIFPFFTTWGGRALLFFGLIAFMIIINVIGAKQSIGLVKIITIFKLLPLAGIILFGFRFIQPSNLHWEHLPTFQTFSSASLVLFFAFAGFETSLGASGEIKNPGRTIPMSILIAGIVVLAVYLLIQTVTQGILGEKMILFKEAPLAAVAEKIIGPIGATLLLICAAVSCFGNVTLDVLCTPRSLFAGANDGLFPKFLGVVHPKFSTPYYAVILYGILIFIFSISGGFKQLAMMASAIVLVIYLAVALATIKMRTKKSHEKTFKAPGGIIIPLIAVASIVWLLTSLGKWEILSTLIFIGIICIFYFATKWIRLKFNPPALMK